MPRAADQSQSIDQANESADYYLWLHINDALKYALKKNLHKIPSWF